MDIVLIAGLWLDGSSWAEVVPHLEAAGHRAHALTLPGMESVDADRSAISLADHVAAVVAAIDAVDGREQVVLVGHSAGAAVAHGAIDVRPNRVARAVYIGGFPAADGEAVVDGLAGDAPDVPLPDWSEFDDEEIRDLDEDARVRFRQRAIPSPAGVVRGPQRLVDERRYRVPVSTICTEFTPGQLRDWIDKDLAPVRELARISNVDMVDLDGGHWPQFTRPAELAQLIIEAIHQPIAPS